MNTSTASHTLVAVFRDRSEAEAAASELRANGFTSSDVFSGRDAGQTTTTANTAHHEGGITGWFKSLFGEDDADERTSYESDYQSGRTFVSTRVNEDQVDRACSILNSHSPVQAIQKDAVTASGVADTARNTTARETSTTGRTASTRNRDTVAGENRDTEAIPVVREELQVGKRSVLRGGVRVYSRMVEEPVEEKIRLREERVSVDRKPVNRATTDADLRTGQEQVFEMKEYAEEPVVSKSSRVVEEIRIGKEATERTETVRDTVRHTEVNVENLGNQTGDTRNTGYDARNTENTGYNDVGYGDRTTNAANYDDTDFRNHFAANYGNSGDRYEDYEPAYLYGSSLAGDPRYSGRSFDEVEPDLRRDYSARYPNSSWEKVKASVQQGWNKLSSKAQRA